MQQPGIVALRAGVEGVYARVAASRGEDTDGLQRIAGGLLDGVVTQERAVHPELTVLGIIGFRGKSGGRSREDHLLQRPAPAINGLEHCGELFAAVGGTRNCEEGAQGAR